MLIRKTRIIIISALLIIVHGGIVAQHLQSTWIVLADNLIPYQSKEMLEKTDMIALKYPQEFSGRLLINENKKQVVQFSLKERTYYLPLTLIVKNIELTVDKRNLQVGDERVDIKTPLPINYIPGDLEKIDQRWNYHAADYSKYVRSEVSKQINLMLKEAKSQGLEIRVVSAYRSFKKQRQLYLRAIARNGLNQKAVAKPGHSEHQLGTTIDVASTNPNEVLTDNFGYTREGIWMKENARRFGFIQSYTIKNQATSGYIPEPWHFRFIGL